MLDLPVLFPFGHGLSYTKFEFSGLAVEKGTSELNISVNVKNTGDRDGAEVVQVYVAQKNPSIRRPKKELKGFKKVWLKKGEAKVVQLPIQLKYAASYWDEVREAWIVEKDTYEVLVGNTSSGDGILKGAFQVEKTTWWNGL
jgi:beta-glucosidase